jgi:Protein of unknown function (DUF3604)
MVARGTGQGKPLPAILGDKKFIRSVWERQTAWAEKYNEPGRFTAMIGYEWSSTDKGNNLHRDVLYRDGKAKADLALPLAAEGVNQDPEKLWQWMAAYEEKSGGQVLAIPHNGNLSNGRMFALADYTGNPLTKKYVETRAEREPVFDASAPVPDVGDVLRQLAYRRQNRVHWLREALLKPLPPGSRVVVVSSGAAINGSPASGGYAGAKATQRFIAGYAQDESRRAGLDITVTAVMPRMTPFGDVGRRGVRAYAVRAGQTEEAYLKQLGELLTPEMAGSALVDLVRADPATTAPVAMKALR